MPAALPSMPQVTRILAPKRLASQSVLIAPTIMAAINGISRRPVPWASLPCTICRKGERMKSTPVIAKPTIVKATVAHENRALLNSLRSISGNLVRSCHTANAATSTAPPAIGPHTCTSVQPRIGCSMMP